MILVIIQRLIFCFTFVGLEVTEEDLKNVAEVSGIYNAPTDYLDSTIRTECEKFLKHPEELLAKDYVESYLLLKYSIE